MTSELDLEGETVMLRRMVIALALVAVALTGISITTIGMSSMEPVQAYAFPG